MIVWSMILEYIQKGILAAVELLQHETFTVDF